MLPQHSLRPPASEGAFNYLLRSRCPVPSFELWPLEGFQSH
jgi:hypothetical protein